MAYNPDQPVSKIKNNGNQVAEVPQSMQPVAGFSGMTPAVAREVATIQGQIMLAKMFPRNMADVWKKVEARGRNLQRMLSISIHAVVQTYLALPSDWLRPLSMHMAMLSQDSKS